MTGRTTGASAGPPPGQSAGPTQPSAGQRDQSQGGWLSRSRPLTFALLLGAGLLAVVGSARPWWRAVGDGARVAFSGTEATGGLSQAMAVVVLAGTLLVLVLKARGRRVLAVLLAVAGFAVALVGALRLRPSADAVRTRIRQVSLVDQYALTATAWPYLFAVAGLATVLAAVLLWLGAPRWTVQPDRFERTGRGSALESTDDPARLWKALDAGIDPTADAEKLRQPDPDVQIGTTGDTMVAIESRDRSISTDRSLPTARSPQLPE